MTCYNIAVDGSFVNIFIKKFDKANLLWYNIFEQKTVFQIRGESL